MALPLEDKNPPTPHGEASTVMTNVGSEKYLSISYVRRRAPVCRLRTLTSHEQACVMRRLGILASGGCFPGDMYSASTAHMRSNMAPKHGTMPAAHEARPASNRRAVNSVVPVTLDVHPVHPFTPMSMSMLSKSFETNSAGKQTVRLLGESTTTSAPIQFTLLLF